MTTQINMLIELEKRIKQLKLESKERRALEFLVENVLGIKNLMPIRVIVERLEEQGISVTRNWLSQSVIAVSRKKGYFIGSCARGIFIIQDENDAKVAWQFYNKKYGAVESNRSNFRKLIRYEGWDLNDFYLN